MFHKLDKLYVQCNQRDNTKVRKTCFFLCLFSKVLYFIKKFPLFGGILESGQSKIERVQCLKFLRLHTERSQSKIPV